MFLEASFNKLTDFSSLIDITQHFNKILDFVLSEAFNKKIKQIQEEKKADDFTFSIFSDGTVTILNAKLCWFDADGITKTEDVLMLKFRGGNRTKEGKHERN